MICYKSGKLPGLNKSRSSRVKLLQERSIVCNFFAFHWLRYLIPSPDILEFFKFSTTNYSNSIDESFANPKSPKFESCNEKKIRRRYFLLDQDIKLALVKLFLLNSNTLRRSKSFYPNFEIKLLLIPQFSKLIILIFGDKLVRIFCWAFSESNTFSSYKTK